MTALSYISKALEGSHLRNSKNSAKANLGSHIFTLNLKYQKINQKIMWIAMDIRCIVEVIIKEKYK